MSTHHTEPLTTSVFDSLPVVTFRNHSLNTVDAIICESDRGMELCLQRLEKMDHIEVLNAGHAVVRRDV